MKLCKSCEKGEKLCKCMKGKSYNQMKKAEPESADANNEKRKKDVTEEAVEGVENKKKKQEENDAPFDSVKKSESIVQAVRQKLASLKK